MDDRALEVYNRVVETLETVESVSRAVHRTERFLGRRFPEFRDVLLPSGSEGDGDEDYEPVSDDASVDNAMEEGASGENAPGPSTIDGSADVAADGAAE